MLATVSVREGVLCSV